MLTDILSVRSFMYARKSNGPRTEHCGTPEWIRYHLVLPFETYLLESQRVREGHYHQCHFV